MTTKNKHSGTTPFLISDLLTMRVGPSCEVGPPPLPLTPSQIQTLHPLFISAQPNTRHISSCFYVHSWYPGDICHTRSITQKFSQLGIPWILCPLPWETSTSQSPGNTALTALTHPGRERDLCVSLQFPRLGRISESSKTTRC